MKVKIEILYGHDEKKTINVHIENVPTLFALWEKYGMYGTDKGLEFKVISILYDIEGEYFCVTTEEQK